MSGWPSYPTIYEINTWVWLSELSLKAGTSLDLSSVPATEWDAIAKFGFDAVWFMGVWERSPAGIAIANRNKNLIESFHQALPDFKLEDNVGSPYCIRRYVVDQHLGGPKALAIARRELAQRGMKLLLDFVPNHVAPDHPWASEHTEYLVHGTAEEAAKDPSAYIEVQGRFCACGRDPYFPPWPDVLQLNAFQPGLRQAVVATISSIADQCDGIRCDMAMLLLNQIFERTWGSHAGPRPPTEYWGDVISPSKERIQTFALLPKPTGTWSGSCNSRGSTSATTSGSMIVWSMRMQRVFDFISVPTSPISKSCFASSKTTMSLGPQRAFPPEGAGVRGYNLFSSWGETLP